MSYSLSVYTLYSMCVPTSHVVSLGLAASLFPRSAASLVPTAVKRNRPKKGR